MLKMVHREYSPFILINASRAAHRCSQLRSFRRAEAGSTDGPSHRRSTQQADRAKSNRLQICEPAPVVYRKEIPLDADVPGAWSRTHPASVHAGDGQQQYDWRSIRFSREGCYPGVCGKLSRARASEFACKGVEQTERHVRCFAALDLLRELYLDHGEHLEDADRRLHADRGTSA